MVSCTIEASGRDIHGFPFTVAFLGAALEKMDEGFYSSIKIVAQFSSPTPLSSDRVAAHIGTPRDEDSNAAISGRSLVVTRREGTSSPEVPHFVLDANARMPFYDLVLTMEGAFSEVYKVTFHLEWTAISGQGHLKSFVVPPPIAVKRLTSRDGEAFQREADVLRRLSCRPEDSHIIKLLSTFKLGLNYHFIFPYADGDLRQFWKNGDSVTWRRQSSEMSNDRSTLWVMQQCAGIATALCTIHSVLNKPLDNARYSSASNFEKAFGRHGDIKPENILWFKDENEIADYGTLKIADFWSL